MLPAQAHKLGIRFSCLVYRAESAFLGQNNEIDDLLELDLVVFAVETLVHAHALQRVKVLLGLFDNRHRDGVIGGFLHDLVVQDEPVLIFDHADPQAKLPARRLCLC